jgi:hypothetical protein
LISPSLREKAPEQEVLLDRQPGEDPPTLGGVGQAQGDDLVGRDAVETLALERDLTRCGPDETGDRAQRRRLAGTVGADEADHLALPTLND